MNEELYEIDLLEKCFDDLFPLTRSITGPGLEESLKYLSMYMPLTIEKVPCGTKVFDWVVPEEWHFKRARLWGPEGELICDSENSNLHVVNYSAPVKKKCSLRELDQHLYSIEKLPHAIPYVTSYYNKTWGFCIPHSVRSKLREGEYTAEIESEFRSDGGVPFAHCTLRGESEREILLTSYLCHPSLANNELSGPLAILFLYNRIKNWKKRRFTYRFVINPETIGSLCYLYRYQNHLREKLFSGIVLTCLGGPSKSLRYKASRSKKGHYDLILKSLAECDSTWRFESFTPVGGSDERQYCSPGFNFPVGQIARTVYGQYDGYHNSLDDKEFMDINQLFLSIDQIDKLLQLSEVSGKPTNLAPYGEPQLGKRGLYPTINTGSHWKSTSEMMTDHRYHLDAILTILSMADGNTPATEIAETYGCPITELMPIMKCLEGKNLIKF